MKKGLTEIVLIVDSSGSMEGARNDTIGGINTFIEEQKKLPGEASLTLVFFDSLREIKYFRQNLKDVKPLTREDYVPGGTTALIDAVCLTIDELGSKLASEREEDRPEHVILAIMTDGEENSSSKFSLSQLSEKVKTQTDVYKWTFFFMGANIDAFATGKQYGFAAANTMSFANSKDLSQSYALYSRSVADVRSST